MTTTLVLPDAIAASLHELVSLDVETGAVLLCRVAHTRDGDVRLLAVELLLVPDDAYERREVDELLIASHGYVPALGRAETLGAVPIWLHTHPGDGSSPKPSANDRRVDEQLGDLFRLRSGSEYYGSVVVSHRRGALQFTGRLDSGARQIEIDRLLCVGPRFALAWSEESQQSELSPVFDRNIRAFGGDVQRVLGDIRVAIVGCGGTGSAVAEQLVRLGVRHLLLVDPDHITDSNLTRVYGSRTVDVGRSKVQVLADHLATIAVDVTVDTALSKITVERTARLLVGADLVFGCTDDNAGRLVLSRFATYMLTPVIDCGVLLTSDRRDRLDGIHGRVTVLYPGTACLVCRNRIDLERAGTEMLDPMERDHRVREGYAPALPGVEPAVVAYTTLVAAYAVGELLERLIGYGPEPAPGEVLLRVHDREVSTNQQAPRERHYCHLASGKLGLGMSDPFLEQTWSS